MMDRFLRRAVTLAGVALLMATVASANVPIPELSTVPACLPVAPNGGLTYQVTIVGSGGPINGSSVQIRFTVVGDTLVCWCNTEPGPRPRTRTQSTNASGVATFNIKAGGCLEGTEVPGNNPFAAEVFADAVKMAEVGVVSPDAVDGHGKKSTSASGWDPAGVCGVSAGDAVYHTTPLASAQYDFCTDLNCDQVCGGADAVILTPFLAAATSCAGDAGP